jgi:hypothetical protein
MSFVKDYLGLLHKMRPKNYQGINGYGSLATFVLEHGREFTPQPLPTIYKRGQKRQCYRNAALLAIDEVDLIYCEGFAMGVIPVNHAWCCDSEGKVVDPTWPDGGEYFGIPIKKEYLCERLQAQETYGILDRWEDRWPMIHADPSRWKISLPGRVLCSR